MASWSFVHFGFPGNTTGWPPTGALFNLCLLYVGESPGESQSISEANNRELQTQQCPIRQVAGNPCRGRFNTKRMAT